MSEEAARYNKGKLRWHNFPMFLIRPMIEVADYGADKYATFNFIKGAPISQYMDCIKRHLDKFEDPTLPDNDPESGVNHLAHAAWNALVAVYMVQNRPELDDRWRPDKSSGDKPTITPIDVIKHYRSGGDITDFSSFGDDGTKIANEELKP